jgi:hypothetical protein
MPVRFFHPIAGSNVITPTGKIKTFFGGYVDVEDDDTETLEMMKALVKSPGSGVTETSGADSGLEQARQETAEMVAANAAKAAAAVAGKKQ